VKKIQKGSGMCDLVSDLETKLKEEETKTILLLNQFEGKGI
jgi:hypothetical protein